MRKRAEGLEIGNTLFYTNFDVFQMLFARKQSLAHPYFLYERKSCSVFSL